MRILIVTERFYPEEFLINDIAVQMHKEGFEVEVLTQIPSYPFDRLYDGYENKQYLSEYYYGIKIHRVRTILGYRYSNLKKIWGYIHFAIASSVIAFRLGYRFDVVFFYHTGPATMAHSSHVLKKIYRKKCVIWTQDIWPDAIFASGIKETKFRRWILELYLNRLYKNFYSISVSCRGFIDIIKSYSKKEIHYIPQWYPQDVKFTQVYEDANELNFTFLGNIGSVQNLENVCLGFLKAVDKGLKAKFHIVGDGVYFSKIKKIVEEKKTEDIILYGKRPSSEMENFIKKAHVMVVSLKDHPLFNLYVPAKFQGYLASGRPILGILKGEVASLIKLNNLGKDCNPGNLDEISDGFNYFAEHREELHVIALNSLRFYQNNYSRDESIKKIMNLFS